MEYKKKRAPLLLFGLLGAGAAYWYYQDKKKKELAASQTATAHLPLPGGGTVDVAAPTAANGPVYVPPANVPPVVANAAATVANAAATAAAQGQTISPGKTLMTGDQLVVTTQTDPLNMRREPDLNAGVIGTVPKGAAVTYLGKSQNGFHYVNYSGRTGWCAWIYLTPVSTMRAA